MKTTEIVASMKAFFGKAWAWVVANKVISIPVAVVLVAGISCAIALTIALHHEHEFSTEFKCDGTSHWHECECGEKEGVGAHQESATYASNDTHHWKDCTACGADLSVSEHAYNQEVATSAYLKSAATETTKAVYYKSCVCGKTGTATFETDKTVTEITNIVINGKTYDGTAVAIPTYNKNSEGAVTVEYKVKTADDATYTTTA
ncbi:MAG: hypothetical protein J6U92_07720, partial [Clostridia bacterium]|nr:hypothetical protein [Clostridia bacterium]